MTLSLAQRLVILGDSLGLPTGIKNTQTPDAIEYEETYPYLLQKLMPEWEIISTCKRSNRVDKQARQQWLFDDIIFYKPKVVVVHLGICDCAPRLFNRYESFILSNLPVSIRNPIITFFSGHRFFFTKHFRKVYVKKLPFKSHMEKIINTICKINSFPILVGIADTNKTNKQKSYNYDINIQKYNQILLKLSKKNNLAYINMHEEGDRILLPDGIHLNKEGCKLLANKIFQIVIKNSH